MIIIIGASIILFYESKAQERSAWFFQVRAEFLEASALQAKQTLREF